VEASDIRKLLRKRQDAREFSSTRSPDSMSET
jgi:hypothetical protein